MSLRGFTEYGVTGPRGPWTRLDHRPTPKNRGSRAYNVRFEPNRVKSRDGFAHGLAVSAKVTSLHHWITNDTGIEINRLIFMEAPDTVKMRDLVSNTTNTLFTETGRSISCAEGGSRLFIATATTAGIGAGQCRVVNALVGGIPSDYAFAGPMTITPTVSATGVGNCTEGAHKFGYVLETRTGFIGKPSPAPSNIFTPVDFTVAAGGEALELEVSGTMPDDASYIHPIMTREDNPNRWYFVPDAAVAVPGGGVWTATMTIDVSDDDLADSAEECDQNFDYLTQDVGGSGPFEPFQCIEFGQRMVYLTPQKAYVSEIQDYQVLTEVDFVVQLPGQRQILGGFPLRGNLYLCGPSWTYSTSDNGDLPSTWGQPEIVSGRIGITGNNCVEWRTGGDYAWIANYAGFYHFTGQFPERPISYMVDAEWRRINWAAAYAIQIKDDSLNQRVYVAAPLDGATEPTHMLVFDYSQGTSWTEVDFSLDNLPDDFSSIGIVVNRATNRPELWVGPSASGNISVQTVDQHDDNGTAIDCQYETNLLVPEGAGWKFMKMGWLELDISGEGTLATTVFGMDRVYQEDLEEITIYEDPGEHPLFPMDFNNENFSVRLRVNAAGHWFDLSRITGYFVKWMTN